MIFLKKLPTLVGVTSIIFFSCFTKAQVDNYEAAIQAYYEHDIDAALIHLKNALKENNSNLPARLLLAEVLIKQHSYSIAEQELNDALLDGADYNLIVEPLGRALLLQGKYNGVLQLDESQQLHSASILSVQLLKAKAYSGLFKNQDAKKLYLDVLTTNPNHSEAMIELASIHIAQGEYLAAERLLTKAEAISQENARFWHVKGQLASKENELVAANKFLAKANQLDANSIAILSSITSNHISQHQYEQANKIADEILQINPKALQAQLMKGRILNELNKKQLAKEVLVKLSSQISAIDESYKLSQPHILFIDAMSSYRQEDWIQAKNKFRIYINQLDDEQDISAVVLLSDVYLKLNQADQALKLLSNYEAGLISNKDYVLVLAELYLQFNKTFKAEYVLDALQEQHKKDESVILLTAKVLSRKGQDEKALALLEAAKFPSSIQYQHMLTTTAFRVKQFDKSTNYAQLLLSLSPESIEYQILYTRILIAQKKFSEAEKVIVNLHQKHPNDRQVRFNYAYMLFNQDNAKQAKKILLSLVNEDSNDSESWFVLAQIAHDAGDTEETIAILERQTKSKDENYRLKALNKLANIYYSEQQFNKSLSVTKVLLQNDRLNSRALLIKAKNLIALNEFEDAKHQLNILFGLWSDDPRNLVILSQLQRQINELESAEESLDTAYSLAPKALPVIIDTTKIKTKLNKLSQAAAIIKQAEKSGFKNNVYLEILKGDIEVAKSKQDKAFKYYLSALNIDDNNVIALMKLVQVSDSDALSNKLIAQLESIVNKYPERAIQRHVLADQLFNRKHYQKAKFQYQQLIIADIPSNKRAWALNNLAKIYLIDKDYQQAIEVSTQAYNMLLAPQIVDTFGWALVLSGDAKQGLSYLRQAYTKSSLNPAIKYHIAYALVELNRPAEAKQLLNSVVNLADTFPEYKLAKALLLSLN